MVQFRGDAPGRVQSKKHGSVYTVDVTRMRGESVFGKVLNLLPDSNEAKASVPMKTSRTSILLDMGVGRRMNTSFSHSQDNVIELDKLVDHGDCFTHLDRPLLVRLKLLRRAGEVVKAVCDSRDIHRKGLRISLPCKLDLRSGNILDIELFLDVGENPLCVRGEVRQVARTHNEDMIRYVVDIEFDGMDSHKSSRIDSFIQTSETQDQHLPA